VNEREAWWRTLNLAVHGVGILISPMRRMRWSYGRILGGVGGSFQVIPDLRWEIDPKLDSGNDLWCGDKALKEAFPNLYGMLARRMLL
jgi:hypothetical protein